MTTIKHHYTSITKDPMGMRIYTLKNGLTVFLSVNKNEPRIFTNVCFRVGSKYDPADTTGLAHYMEHMLFKGTNKIGTLDWEKESVLLEKIAVLFEQYRQTENEEERKAIYQQIDELSYKATEFVAPNEYDRLVTALGAKQTNAYTWVEQTVYVNDIPSNELERWVKLERERFGHIALRLFHTELETVYEEYNMSQDKDFRKVNQEIRKLLFPTHPYGTQTTLGSPEHLKRPSMRNIERFYEQYYVPNNAAICLSGDFDPDEAIQLIKQHFGDWQPNNFTPFNYEEQRPLESVKRSEILGQESAYMQLGWRTAGGHSADYILAIVIKQMLYNEQAGLFDLYLNQEQKVLDANAFNWVYEDYSVLGLYGKARQGQQLEEVEKLLLAEVKKLRTGDFPDWLLPAAISDMKLADLKGIESNGSRVSAAANCFILGVSWKQFVQRYETLEKLTKKDIIEYAKKHLRADNYAVVYKKEGTNPDIVKVDKPTITPVPLQSEAISVYAKQFLQAPPPGMKPVFADFQSGIQREIWQKGLKFDYVYNPQNPLFRLDYIFEMGKNNSLELSLAMTYLPYLGTSRYTAAAIQQEFFRLGLHFEIYDYEERSHISLTGLEESMEAGLKLVEHILTDLQADQKIWDAVAEDIIKKRANQKQNKDSILRSGMSNYAKYGPLSPFTYRLPEKELRRLDVNVMLDTIKNLHQYEHRVYYYGQMPHGEVRKIIQSHHKVATTLKEPLPPKIFIEQEQKENKVFFTHFPMVQNDVMLLSKGTSTFNMQEHKLKDLYNEYFGYGLSSVVFQEIREAKALAYSTYAFYSSPSRADKAHYLRAYVGTQPDKVADALPTLKNLLENMPLREDSIEQARLSLLQRIESDRIAPRNRYWEAQGIWDLDLEHDILKDIYAFLQSFDSNDLAAFHHDNIKGRNYNIMVLGDRANTPLNFLEQYGELKELSMEELFTLPATTSRMRSTA